MRKLRVLWLLLLLGACADAAVSGKAPPAPTRYANWPNALETQPHGDAQTDRVCARGGADNVRDLFCVGARPVITSLMQLQAALQVGSADLTGFRAVSQGRITDLAITGHSTSLSARSVSAINARLIVFRVELVGQQLVTLAFTRGEQMVEMAVRDRVDHNLHFYVLGFRQACNLRPGGCTPGELLTPAIESDWRDATLYDETDLTNTVLDCAPCHQAAGPGSTKSLLMQELNHPWTHWFWKESEGGKALLEDYVAAKGDESLAGMTAEQIRAVDPNGLSAAILLVNPSQTFSFDSSRIESEIKDSAAAEGGSQPLDNSVVGESATWRAAFAKSQRGEAIALPYPNVKVTDPEKLARMTEAYRAYARGELTAAALPDLRDVFADDPERLAELGVTPAPGLDGRGVLLSACGQCHNERLDQSLSRARFRADLQGMSRAEKEAAIARLMLPPDNPSAMPPARLRWLSDEAKQRAIDALRE